MDIHDLDALRTVSEKYRSTPGIEAAALCVSDPNLENDNNIIKRMGNIWINIPNPGGC